MMIFGRKKRGREQDFQATTQAKMLALWQDMSLGGYNSLHRMKNSSFAQFRKKKRGPQYDFEGARMSPK